MIDALDRFLKAQEHTSPTALCEIRSGRKESHWMWFIFPQMRGLGMSDMAYIYGISDRSEAEAYLSHPVLSARLNEITESLLMLDESHPNAIFGEINAMKLRSSMTLFDAVGENGSVFHRALDKFFGSKTDQRTLKLLGDTDK